MADAYTVAVVIKNGVSWLLYVFHELYAWFLLQTNDWIMETRLTPGLIKATFYDQETAKNYLN